MEIGKLNRRITILQKSTTSDKIGNQPEKWTKFYTCWAEVKIVSGREYWQARQDNEEKTTNFKIRYCKKLENLNSTDFIILFRNVRYNIQVVDNEFFGDRFLNIKTISVYDRGTENE